MNNQEMQFADPEWRPPQQGNNSTDQHEQETYIPQPINPDPREQPQQQTPSPEYDRGYEGYAPYAGPQAEKIAVGQQAQRPYRRRSPWLWLIVVLIAFALLGRAATPFYGPHAFFPHHIEQSLKPASFSVSDHPTIVINGGSDTIDVQAGSANTVTVTPSQGDGGFGNAPQVTYGQDGNTITVNVAGSGFGFDDVTLNVTVPTNADIQIHSGSGDIQVSGVSGQSTLTTGSGNIDLTQDTLSGQSTLTTGTGDIKLTQSTLSGKSTIQTGSGDITLDGSLDPNGNYRLETGSGDIDATLTGNSSVHVDATTDNGSITSDFSEVSVQSPGGNQAHGDIGNPPRAELTLHTGSGDITLNKP